MEAINTKSPKFKRMMKLLNANGKIGRRHDYAYKASKGRTESTQELYEFEVEQIIARLLKETPQAPISEAYPERKKMRGKIVHYLCLLGYTNLDGKPDYQRIDRFVINIGTRNPRKVILNYLYPDELRSVLTQVEAMYKKETKI